jgi:hypothetical protein
VRNLRHKGKPTNQAMSTLLVNNITYSKLALPRKERRDSVLKQAENVSNNWLNKGNVGTPP